MSKEVKNGPYCVPYAYADHRTAYRTAYCVPYCVPYWGRGLEKGQREKEKKVAAVVAPAADLDTDMILETYPAEAWEDFRHTYVQNMAAMTRNASGFAGQHR